MRKLCLAVLMAALAVWGFFAVACAEAEETAEEADWTVMFYMCGSDLESKYGLGTYSMLEIESSSVPSWWYGVDESGRSYSVEYDNPKINITVETGGSSRWQEEDKTGRSLTQPVSEKYLQRYAAGEDLEENLFWPTLILQEELPLDSMCKQETLSDFIQWSVAKYPAKRYALVLWDHGGGSRTGLLTDELFDNDIMYLSELKDALEAQDVYFEIVAIDACLMSSLETAQALQARAHYMVASEEVASGQASAFEGWLSELYINPDCDGAHLGRVFCDIMQKKIAEMDDNQAEALYTYSVVDLSGIDAVSEYFDRMFEAIGALYESMPDAFCGCAEAIWKSEAYGMGESDMYDLNSFLFNQSENTYIPQDVRNGLANALSDAVIYTVKGIARSRSGGLSFCCAPVMDKEDLEIYANNCHSAPYLAFLDALNPDWEAPDWVYEKTRRLTPVSDISEYAYNMELSERDGEPVLIVDNDLAVYECNYKLYLLNEDTGERIGLADGDYTANEVLDEAIEYSMAINGSWPAIDSQLCSLQGLGIVGGVPLYNVPVQIGDTVYYLRMGLESKSDPETYDMYSYYEVYGLWEGYDADTDMPNRNIVSLMQMQGREYELLYPIHLEEQDARKRYHNSTMLNMFRQLEVEVSPLPTGTYYLEYTVTDIFGREQSTSLIKLNWDGSAFSVEE